MPSLKLGYLQQMDGATNESTVGLTATPIAGAKGAEITGVDLAQPLDERNFQAWLEAFETYHFLVFRDQFFTDEQFVAFSRWFGELEEHPDPKDWAAPDQPLILRVSNVFRDTDEIKPVDDVGHKSFTLGTSVWHSDSSYRQVPAKMSLLYAKEIPPSGSQTQFADMAAAFDALPDDKKAEFEKLIVVHDFETTRRHFNLPPRPKHVSDAVPPVRHPLVRSIPGGGKALLLGMHASHIEGMDEDESRELMDWLQAWSTQDRFVYTHDWRVGDLVMWDNRSSMHRAMPYPIETERRLLHRTTIIGDGPLI